MPEPDFETGQRVRDELRLGLQVDDVGGLARQHEIAAHADLLLQKLPRGPDLVERTRRAIGERLRGGDSSLEGVARELGTSARSLQRHLNQLGYSYNSLADEVRAATAKLYLEQPDIAIAEVAYLLGFADPSTFNRAFKRWTGETPARARTAHRGSAGEGVPSGGPRG